MPSISIAFLALFAAVGDAQRLRKKSLLHVHEDNILESPANHAAADSFFEEDEELVTRVLAEDTSMPPKPPVCKNTVFDYVIVGSGPAGAAAAYKLSEDPTNRILLLEEGGYSLYPNKGVQEIWRATDWFGLIFNHEIAKPGYETVPQPELNDRVAWAPRSMVTGGCMSHNAFVVVRGSKPAYDEWGVKAPGWAYKDLAPHWQTVLDHFDFTTNDGSVSRPEKNSEYIDSLVDICVEAGWKLNEAFNKADAPHNGCNYRQHQGILDTDVNDEPFIRRQTAYTQFIQPILKDRPNLHVLTNRRVTKVEIEGTSAKGVHTEDPWSHGSFYYEATNEVILSAGVYDTPKLLMLSGVGPADHLSEMGIPLVKDMPGVGSRLVDDSFSFITGPALKEQPETWDSIWAIDGIQMWGAPDLDDSITPDVNWNLHIQPNFFDGKVSLGVSVEPLALKSEGTVRLKSKDPADAPLIDPKYFSHPDDMPLYLEAYKAGIALLDTETAKSITEGERYEPPPSANTDEEIEAFIRANYGVTDFHPVGTCRMGMDPDGGDVVDNRGKVYGITGLRVFDSSIFPELTHGNPTAPSMLVGLRGAELILDEYK